MVEIYYWLPKSNFLVLKALKKKYPTKLFTINLLIFFQRGRWRMVLKNFRHDAIWKVKFAKAKVHMGC